MEDKNLCAQRNFNSFRLAQINRILSQSTFVGRRSLLLRSVKIVFSTFWIAGFSRLDFLSSQYTTRKYRIFWFNLSGSSSFRTIPHVSSSWVKDRETILAMNVLGKVFWTAWLSFLRKVLNNICSNAPLSHLGQIIAFPALNQLADPLLDVALLYYLKHIYLLNRNPTSGGSTATCVQII